MTKIFSLKAAIMIRVFLGGLIFHSITFQFLPI